MRSSSSVKPWLTLPPCRWPAGMNLQPQACGGQPPGPSAGGQRACGRKSSPGRSSSPHPFRKTSGFPADKCWRVHAQVRARLSPTSPPTWLGAPPPPSECSRPSLARPTLRRRQCPAPARGHRGPHPGTGRPPSIGLSTFLESGST